MKRSNIKTKIALATTTILALSTTTTSIMTPVISVRAEANFRVEKKTTLSEAKIQLDKAKELYNDVKDEYDKKDLDFKRI